MFPIFVILGFFMLCHLYYVYIPDIPFILCDNMHTLYIYQTYIKHTVHWWWFLTEAPPLSPGKESTPPRISYPVQFRGGRRKSMRTCTYLHTYLHIYILRIYIFTVNYKYFSFIVAKGAMFVCFVQKYFVKVWNCWFEKCCKGKFWVKFI